MTSRTTNGSVALVVGSVAALLIAVLAPSAAAAAPGASTSALSSSTRSTTAPSTTTPSTTAAPPGAGGPSTTSVPTGGSSADSVDVLTASRDQVRAEVAGIDRRLRDQEARLAFSEALAQEALVRTAAARDRATAATAAAERARVDVRSYALEAFIRPPEQDALSVLAISQAEEAGYAGDVLQIVADQRRQVVDVMVAAEARARKEQDQAQAAADAARQEADRAQGQVDALQNVRADQAQLAAGLDARLDSALAEATSLKTVDAKAAQELTAQETALRASVPVAAPATATPVTTPVATGGGATRPAAPTTAPPRTPTTRPPTTTPPPPSGLVTWADVVKVGGIWVNKRIAGQVRSLLNAATAAGFSLSGGGFRDPASQIALRQAHCGPSAYAIYQMPASQCSPPTARPGTSMHEQGLAIDFTSSGHLISSRSDPAFAWLAGNAARFGFYNLPSEPWHWSVNGN